MLLVFIALSLAANQEGRSISFEEALAMAERSPRTQSAREAIGKRRDLSAQASRLDSNPFVLVQPGWRTGPPGAGFEIYGTLAQNFNVSGYQAAKRTSLERELKLDEALARSSLHELRLMIARLWFASWSARVVQREAQQEREIVADWVEHVARLGADGHMSKVELAVARTYLAEIELEVLAREGEQFEASLELAQVLSLTDGPLVHASEQLPALMTPETVTLERSLAQVPHAPRVLVAERLVDVERARADEAWAGRGGWWMQGGVNMMREGLGDVVVQGMLQVTLPLFDRGERERAPLVAAATQAEGERRAALETARSERLRIAHEVLHTREVLNVLEQQLVPAADEAAAGERRRLEAGESTAQEWVLSRRAAISARVRKARAQADHALACFLAAELAAVVEPSKSDERSEP